MDKSWFEMRSEIRRLFSDAVWIPLRQSLTDETGEYGHLGHVQEYIGVRSVAVHLAERELGETISWSDTSYEHGVYSWSDGYKAADVYQRQTGIDLGLELVIEQGFDGAEPRVWHLNQDIVLALGLLREGDNWICPKEGYVEVAKINRNFAGRETSLIVRSEFLRDYLAARCIALRLTTYRQRRAVLEDASHIGWNRIEAAENIFNGRFEGRAWEIHAGGFPYSEKKAVFRAARTDVDFDSDVPIMGQTTNDNVASDSWTFGETGPKLWHVEGEFWRDEWIEPAKRSSRIRGDTSPSTTSFIVDASGERLSADDLNDEDIGRWLWFESGVVNAVLARRGSSLSWYTRETGSLELVHGYRVHFGINERDLINTYAYDVARLPEWQRQVWAGFNAAPDGKVSRELLSSHVEATPAKTRAPERHLAKIIDILNMLSIRRWGKPLFREHPSVSEIQANVHRFRTLESNGLLGLAKDVARLTADSLDIDSLNIIAPPASGERRGSLKSLEAALATLVGKDDARRLVGPLFGIYDLRVADAHLPSKTTQQAYSLLGIEAGSTPVRQGWQMLHAVVSTLYQLAYVIDPEANQPA